MGDTEFSVAVFFDDDTHTYIGRWMNAKNAVELAKAVTDRTAMLPSIDKVIITDGGDFTVFMWERGKGLTFPTPEMRAEHANEEKPK